MKNIFYYLLLLLAFSNTTNAAEQLTEAQLGQILFLDTAFSVNRTMSCATCHEPVNSFTDHRENTGRKMVSLGDDKSSLGSRNTPMAAYANTSPSFHYDDLLKEYVGGQFLDGRANTLADQAMGPPLNPVEMGLPDAETLVKRLQENPFYVATFKRLYGEKVFEASPQEGILPAFQGFANAIQAFENTEQFASYDSKYDRFLKGEYELTVLEDLGRTLFFSNNNVNCNSCHLLKTEDSPKEPFTNHQYRNIGVPSNAELISLGHLKADFIDHGLLENPAVSAPKYDGKFKNPSLRNVAVTGPYMHNGVFKDLRTVMEFYDHYNNPERTINPETGKPWQAPEVPQTVDKADLKAQALTDRKIDALVAFMKTLTDKRYEPLLEASQK
ncbi:methylamine utilization protein MauG [Psychromonas sp. RZ22]|uniref:cytochrome-c peroxidase n=1 Tax=Psychromonas algarum TaxID=2555643 RepID=UPI001067F1D2|nr:cytochrome c peroxidase [Psychromonas sp. RZ22]TEW54840.1 methylamine utilization protein MauG [Psychromonas sp. RZ22]